MQRRVPGAGSVWVCAIVQQPRGKRPLTAVSCHHQRADPISLGVIDVRSGSEEETRRGQIALPRRKQQRGAASLLDVGNSPIWSGGVRDTTVSVGLADEDVTDVRSRVDVRTSLDQWLYEVHVL